MKSRKWLILVIFTAIAAVTLLPVISGAVSIEQGKTGGASQRIIPQPPLIPPCCTAGNPLDCIRMAKVGKAIKSGSLWVFPIKSTGCSPDLIISMDRAQKRGALSIYETPSGNVNMLIAENKGQSFVLLMSGEMIKGGKQDRIISHDVLLPPRSGPIQIPVFCSERRRWSKSIGTFKNNDVMAPAKLRQNIYTGAKQSEVWSGIQQRMKSGKVDSVTENMGSLYDQGEMAKNVARCEKPFRNKFPKGTIGMVIFHGNRPLGIETFGNPGLFNDLHSKVLRSYIWDYAHTGCKAPPLAINPPSPFQAKSYIDSLNWTNFRRMPTVGAGCRTGFSHGSHSGQALIHKCNLIHLSEIGGAPAKTRPIIMEEQ